jgi:hypothetical protein
MVAPVPAQITKLALPSHAAAPRRPRLTTLYSLSTPFLSMSSAPRAASIPCSLIRLRTLSVATGLPAVAGGTIHHSRRQTFRCAFCIECLYGTFRHAKSFVCIGLLPLCRLFALFSALASFVFNRLEPLSTKHPGGGTSHALPLSALTLRSLRLSVVIRPRICPSFVFILVQIPFLVTLFFSHPCKTPGGCVPPPDLFIVGRLR